MTSTGTNIWFTRADAPLERDWVKRFDPLHWTVDFPAGASASLVTGAHDMTVEAGFLRKGDLIGLIFESRDRRAHAAHAREERRDYSGCVLKFRWVAEGLMPLDAANGATLTIEGEDADGTARSWYVRLWNYAVGSASDAVVTINFDALDAGYSLPGERVFVHNITRIFVSIVPPDYVSGSSVMRVAAGRVRLSDIRCDGPGSVVPDNDCVVPELPLGICTAYDDCYDLAPERIVAAAKRLGYRGTINHYIGMSHYSTLGADGLVDAGAGMNAAARAWHAELARAAKAHGFELIFSLSFELPESRAPGAWAQRTSAGAKGLTGYDPPSVLLSPAHVGAVGYLSRIAGELVGLSVAAGLVPRIQVGEPWWWVTAAHEICLYDDAARVAFGAALGGSPVAIGDIRGSKSAAEKALLDAAGVLLAGATAAVFASARAVSAAVVTHLLVYLPGPMDPAAPEVRRANLPVAWASPAADVLQLEDYEWVTGGADARRRGAYAAVEARLGYGPANQHYLSGFASAATRGADWRAIVAAADEARGRGVGQVLVWALPQIMRDGLTIFGGDDEMDAFDEVDFPIAIGVEASVAPGFSTNVVTSASGHEFRNANWASARLRFDAGPGVRGDAELETLIAFFRARRGSAVGFRFRDPYDFSSGGMTGAAGALDQVLGSGDGVRTRFALVKHYGNEERRITRPVAGSVVVAVSGVARATGWTIEAGGTLLFDVAPGAGAAVTAGYLFDVPVRFGDDRLEINRASFLAGAAPSVPLIEVREG
jgi:uncharacterized protein (TIGR02217 family)